MENSNITYELARLKALLMEGQRLSGQGSHQRRAPSDKATPLLVESKAGLRKLVREYPDTAEAWLALSFAEESLLNYPAARRALERYLDLGGERNRKTLKRLVNLEESETKWANLILSPVQLEFLGAFLEFELAKSDCDHTHRLTELWLKEHFKSNGAPILEALKEHGGYCDCEVLFNVV